MNGRYVILYALILAAMAGILIVGLFDWRLLDCDGPVQSSLPNRGESTQIPVTHPHASNHHRRISSTDADNSQPIAKTNLYKEAYSQKRITRIRPADSDSDYIVIEDENGGLQVMNRDGIMVEDTTLRQRLIGELNTSQAKTTP